MKKNKKLFYAWVSLIVFLTVFIAVVETLYSNSQYQKNSYQYRILIDKNIIALSENNDNEKKSVDEKQKKDLDDDLYENSQYGLLPKISPDGVRVVDVYSSKPSINSERKKIKVAFVITNQKYDDRFKNDLSRLGNVKVSFIIPHYLPDIGVISKAIVDDGHEFFIQMPTQSSIHTDFKSTVSPFLANSSAEDNLLKLRCVLSSAKYAIGIANTTHTLFTKSDNDMSVVLKELSKRGMAYLDIENIQLDLKDEGPIVFTAKVVKTDGLDLDKLNEGILLVDFNEISRFLDIAHNVIILPVTYAEKK